MKLSNNLYVIYPYGMVHIPFHSLEWRRVYLIII